MVFTPGEGWIGLKSQADLATGTRQGYLRPVCYQCSLAAPRVYESQVCLFCPKQINIIYSEESLADSRVGKAHAYRFTLKYLLNALYYI